MENKTNNPEVDEEVIRNIIENSDMRRFSVLYSGSRMSIFQDFGVFETPNISVTYDAFDLQEWSIHLTVFFWSLTITWSGDKNTWSIFGLILYTLARIVIIATLIYLVLIVCYFIDYHEFIGIVPQFIIQSVLLAAAISAIFKIINIFKKS